METKSWRPPNKQNSEEHTFSRPANTSCQSKSTKESKTYSNTKSHSKVKARKSAKHCYLVRFIVKFKIIIIYLAARLNSSLAYLKQDETVECIKQCDKALEIAPNNVKALYRRAQVCMNILCMCVKNCFRRYKNKTILTKQSSATRKYSKSNRTIRRRFNRLLFVNINLLKFVQKRNESLLACSIDLLPKIIRFNYSSNRAINYHYFLVI